MRIKICGITNLDDAIICIEYGADMLGFNFYQGSPRYIGFEQCRNLTRIIKSSYPEISLVGIFVNNPFNEIVRNIDECSLDFGQLCGDEPVDYFYRFGERVLKAIRPVDRNDMERQIEKYPIRNNSPNILIDSSSKGTFGGSGQLANWKIAAELARKYDILLAGGLTSENVQDAINQVNPWGVDVASGVETVPGKKDPIKVKNLISRVRVL